MFVISLIMFYHNRMTVVYKVIVSVIYSYVDTFICIDYMGILQHKLSTSDKKFKNNFNDFSGLGIPEILMNIMSCHGFQK